MDFADLKQEFLNLLLLFSVFVSGTGQKCVFECFTSGFPPLELGETETDIVHEFAVVDMSEYSLFFTLVCIVNSWSFVKHNKRHVSPNIGV